MTNRKPAAPRQGLRVEADRLVRHVIIKIVDEQTAASATIDMEPSVALNDALEEEEK